MSDEVITVLCPTAEDRPVGMAVVEARAEVRYVVAAELEEALVDADALVVWDFFTQAVEPAWHRAHRLRWVHVAAAGVDRFLFPALVESPVVITNARGVFDRPIAEYVLCLILARTKSLPQTLDLQQRRDWRPRFQRRLVDETVLVVGAGSIGRAIARLLRAVGVQVVGVDRQARVDDDFDQLVATEELFDRLPTADHVVLALPLTPATDGLVDATFLSAMKPGAHLVNIGRGELVDEADLVDALGGGLLGGASLDVFREEPLTSQSSLWDVPGLLVSPHMSGLVHDLREHMAHQVAENAMRFLEGRPLRNVVDKVLGFVEDS